MGAEAKRALYWKRIAAGQCVVCAKPVDKYVRCLVCRMNHLARVKRWQQRRAA